MLFMVRAKLPTKILIDTNVFLWLLEFERPSTRLREYFADREKNRFYFSHASAWEISIKYGIGKIRLPDSPELFIPERIRLAEFLHLSIELQHVLRVHSLPKIHKDPFDRLLVSQAKVEGLTILTSDKVFRRYKIDTMSPADLPQ